MRIVFACVPTPRWDACGLQLVHEEGTVIGDYVVLSMLTCSIQHAGYRLGKIIMPIANSDTDETITGTNRVTMAITKLFELINIAGRYTTRDPSFKVTVKYSVSDGDHRLINACIRVLLCVHIYCTFHFDKAKKCHNKDFVRAESIEYVKAFLKFLRDCSFPILGEWMRTVLLIVELERLGEHEWLRYWRAQWADKILCRSAAAVYRMQRSSELRLCSVYRYQVEAGTALTDNLTESYHNLIKMILQHKCSFASVATPMRCASSIEAAYWVRVDCRRRVNWTRALSLELDFAEHDSLMQKPFAVAPAVTAETNEKAAKMYAPSHSCRYGAANAARMQLQRRPCSHGGQTEKDAAYLRLERRRQVDHADVSLVPCPTQRPLQLHHRSRHVATDQERRNGRDVHQGPPAYRRWAASFHYPTLVLRGSL